MMRFNLNISDSLNEKIDEVARLTGQDQSEILRKALLLYFVANEGLREGKKLGLFNAQTNLLETQIVGL